MIGLFWTVPLLPLVAFAVLAVFGFRLRRFAGWSAVFSVAWSTAASVLGLLWAAQDHKTEIAVSWLSVGSARFVFSLMLDPLSAISAFVVSLVTLVVFIYSITYMRDDSHVARFFTEFSLFAGSMLVLVMAADLMTLFIAWELVGLCSYLLIGFYLDKPEAPGASTKALVVTRLTDMAMLAGILLLVAHHASLGIVDLNEHANLQHSLSTAAAAVLIAIGALGKSAQFPFQGWLPDAMAGPTPVSALLHSATMVAAGAFVIARLFPFFKANPDAMTLVAWAGVITSIVGGLAALVEKDLKRLLAYSTMSQLGLMMTGLGAGSLIAGMLLLIVHAFYKSCLFLAAGDFDHAVESTSLAKMRGIGRRFPPVFWAFLIAVVALAGLPAGVALPPKDPAMAAAWFSNGFLFWAALAGSVLTALYSGRAFAIIAEAQSDGRNTDLRPIPAGLIYPTAALGLLIMAAFLVNSRLLGQPLETFLRERAPESLPVTGITLTVALAAFFLPLWLQRRHRSEIVWPFLKPVTPALGSELGFTAVYRRIAAFANRIVQAVADFDRQVFDRLANGLASATLRVVRMVSDFDRTGVDRTISSSASELLPFSQWSRRVQTGRIENYLFGIVIWSIVLISALLIQRAVVR